MTKWWGQKRGGFLFPTDDASKEIFGKLPLQKFFEVEVKQPRNPLFHRLVFALFGKIAEAFDEDIKVVRHKLLVAIGEYHEIRFPDGTIDRVPNSLSIANMDEMRFKEMFERLVKGVYAIYGILPTDIRREVDLMLAPKTEMR